MLNSLNVPSYSTISRFLSKASDIIYELFCQFVEKLFKLSEIPTETIYIDGTKIEAYVEKFNKYTNYLVILGERNSFSKTDKEATFMRMKKDYMCNGQLKPGYNLQIGVISEYIASYEIFHNPADTKTLILFFEKIKSQNIEIKNVVADAGYESFPNYEYLEKIIKYNNEFKRLSKKSKII